MIAPFTRKEFIAALLEWAANGSKDPRLGASPEQIVSQGYELWVAERPVKTRRSLALFEARLVERNSDIRPGSLWRKMKGHIRPKKEELRAFLSILLEDDEQRSPLSDERLTHLVDLIIKGQLDLLADPAVGLVLSSHGELVLGHSNETRVDKFRNIQMVRLSNLLEQVGERGIPLIVWILDASNLFRQGADAYWCRRGVTGLIDGLSATLATPLLVERSEPGARSRANASAPLVIDVTLNQSSSHTAVDLRRMFLRTSAVCLVGPPPEVTARLREYLPHAKGSYNLVDSIDLKSYLHDPLMPEAVLNQTNLHSVVDGESVSNQRLVNSVRDHSFVLGTKIPFGDLVGVTESAVRPHKIYVESKRPELKTSHNVYWEEPKSEEGADEHRLDEIPTPSDVNAALRMVLVAAAGKLDATPTGPETSAGAEMLDLLNRAGIAVLSIPEFLNLNTWFYPANIMSSQDS
ncbi:hypothetical protein [Parvibaculum sp.]|uniref:hypothetical protein n=1 Tax=Parvibaculum sp. TaxID=2024848 RepID=UPI00260A3931|nr:hypothetical protein [Parvibaculum sp.]MCW5726224.1 hypothetical protein [Parvibaculum sp.]